MRKKLNADLEKYEIFTVYPEEEFYVAIDIKLDRSRLNKLYREYGGYSHIPNDEMVNVYKLRWDEESDIYSLNENDEKIEIPINRLNGVVIWL